MGCRGLVVVLSMLLGGCFLAPWSPERPPSDSVSGPAVYAEGCERCHEARVGKRYAESVHAALGIRCGQCHAGGNHPDFAPVRDATCAGCHQPQFQQTVTSRHFTSRIRHPLDGDRPARVALRRGGFTAGGTGARKFVGDAASGELGGRLCAACHFDEHRLGLAALQREAFCIDCHAKADHFPAATNGPTNRCVACHVRIGETVTGQIVNTHRFPIPGS